MLTTGEVAKLFQVSAQTVINWLAQGRMPYERIGRGPRRLTEETVLNYIKEVGVSVEALNDQIYAKLQSTLATKAANNDPAVLVLNQEQRIIAWSEPARVLLGFSPGKVLGKPVTTLIAGVEGSDQGIERLLRSPWEGNTLDLEVGLTPRAGRPLKVSLVAQRFQGRKEPAGFLLVFF